MVEPQRHRDTEKRGGESQDNHWTPEGWSPSAINPVFCLSSVFLLCASVSLWLILVAILLVRGPFLGLSQLAQVVVARFLGRLGGRRRGRRFGREDRWAGRYPFVGARRRGLGHRAGRLELAAGLLPLQALFDHRLRLPQTGQERVVLGG